MSYRLGVTSPAARAADPRPTALVTGATGGLGAAAVERFLAAGWRVAAADLAPPPEADRAGVLPLGMDVTDDVSVEAAAARVAAWSPAGLDAVVTYAGIGCVGPLMDLPLAEIERVLDINVLGTHRTVRATWPLVEAAGGRFILIGSEPDGSTRCR